MARLDPMSSNPVRTLNRALLAAVCQASGIAPNADVARLASADVETCAVVAALIRRAYRAGCASAAEDTLALARRAELSGTAALSVRPRVRACDACAHSVHCFTCPCCDRGPGPDARERTAA